MSVFIRATSDPLLRQYLHSKETNRGGEKERGREVGERCSADYVSSDYKLLQPYLR